MNAEPPTSASLQYIEYNITDQNAIQASQQNGFGIGLPINISNTDIVFVYVIIVIHIAVMILIINNFSI